MKQWSRASRFVATRDADEQLVLRHHDSPDLVIGELGRPGLPDDVSTAGVEGVQRGVGRWIEHQVAVHRHRPRRVLTCCPDGPQPMLPEQVSRPCVQRLHRVGHVRRQEHHAVVHDRRDLLSHSIFERPRPFQLKEARVLRRNLCERTVVPARVRPVVHQPIAIGRIREHLGGDGAVTLNRAWYGQAHSRRRRRRGVVVSSPSTPAAATASRRCSGRSRQARGHLTVGNRRNWHAGRGCKRARAGLGAIGFQKKRHDRCVRVRRKTVWVFRWHRLTDAREQRLGCLRTPGVHERSAGERGRLTAARERPAVTCGATLRVRGLAGVGLLVGVRFRLVGRA